MQPVVASDDAPGVEREPALALHVPRHRKRLQSATREVDEVLLERLPAEGVGGLEGRDLTTRQRGLDPVPAVAAKETRPLAVALEHDVREVPADRGLTGFRHRQVVVRAGPGPDLGLVTAGAARAPDVGGVGDDPFPMGPDLRLAQRRVGARRQSHDHQ